VSDKHKHLTPEQKFLSVFSLITSFRTFEVCDGEMRQLVQKRVTKLARTGLTMHGKQLKPETIIR